MVRNTAIERNGKKRTGYATVRNTAIKRNNQNIRIRNGLQNATVRSMVIETGYRMQR